MQEPMRSWHQSRWSAVGTGFFRWLQAPQDGHKQTAPLEESIPEQKQHRL